MPESYAGAGVRVKCIEAVVLRGDDDNVVLYPADREYRNP